MVSGVCSPQDSRPCLARPNLPHKRQELKFAFWGFVNFFGCHPPDALQGQFRRGFCLKFRVWSKAPAFAFLQCNTTDIGAAPWQLVTPMRHVVPGPRPRIKSFKGGQDAESRVPSARIARTWHMTSREESKTAEAPSVCWDTHQACFHANKSSAGAFPAFGSLPTGSKREFRFVSGLALADAKSNSNDSNENRNLTLSVGSRARGLEVWGLGKEGFRKPPPTCHP